MNANKKHVIRVFGKNYYFLGQDVDGINHFMEAASWDCDWYWGGGYVETFTNNNRPAMSKDISSHQHFDSLFFNGSKCGFDLFKEKFVVNPYSEGEIWKILELMKSFYIAREYADMLYRGGANYTCNPAMEVIKNSTEYNMINKIVIPEIMEELYKIMSGN